MESRRNGPPRQPPRSYVKPTLHDQGDARLITKGGGSGTTENIVWSMDEVFPMRTGGEE